MFRKKLMSRTLLGGMLSMTLVGQPLLTGKAIAAGGDFSLDFTAAAPFTYDHTTGGGAFDDRTIGKNKDVVESLEGGDFACGELVSFLTQIQVDAGATGAQTIDLTYVWTADTTGQSGVALDTMVNAVINRGVIAGGVGEGLGGTDSGNNELDLNSDATIVATNYIEATFSKGAEHAATVRVTDLDPGENVILRFELNLVCNGQKPTGNMQARLDSASVFAPVSDDISAGDQTIPFKQVGAIKCPDPKFCEPPPPPK
jgi:hypothetical protein